MPETCCGVLPRRTGILVWGYANLILYLLWMGYIIYSICDYGSTNRFSLLGIGIFSMLPVFTIVIMLLLIFSAHKVVTVTAFVAYALFMIATPFALNSRTDDITTGLLADVLFSFKGLCFTTVLIIGSLLKCHTVTSLYYYSGLIFWVESACTVVILVIGTIIGIINNVLSHWTASEILQYFAPLCVSFILIFLINVLLQPYILFLLKKEMNHYEMNKQKAFTCAPLLNEEEGKNVQLQENINNEGFRGGEIFDNYVHPSNASMCVNDRRAM